MINWELIGAPYFALNLSADDVEAVGPIEVSVDIDLATSIVLRLINYPSYIFPTKDVSAHDLSLHFLAEDNVQVSEDILSVSRRFVFSSTMLRMTFRELLEVSPKKNSQPTTIQVAS